MLVNYKTNNLNKIISQSQQELRQSIDYNYKSGAYDA